MIRRVTATICLLIFGLGGCSTKIYDMYAAPVGANTATLQYRPTQPSTTLWANLQFVWAGSNLEMTDASTFRHFSGGVVSPTYGGVATSFPEQIQSDARFYLYTFIAQGNLTIAGSGSARHCRSFVSFVPAMGGRYSAADYGDDEHCAIRIVDLRTNQLAPGFEVHDPEPLSNQFK